MNNMRQVRYALKQIDNWFSENFGGINVLFYVENIYGWASQKPIINSLRELSGDKKINIKVTFKDQSSILKQNPSLLDDIGDLIISKEKAVWMKWNFVIHTDICCDYFYRDSIKICLKHGSGFGNVETSYSSVQFLSSVSDVYMGLSNEEGYHIKKEVGDEAFFDRLFVAIGAPKLDPLFQSSGSQKSNLFLKFGLNQNKKTLLIESHWTSTSIISELGKEFIQDAITKYSNYNIIITVHPRFWNVIDENHSIKDDITKLIANTNNTVLAADTDFLQCIQLADLFVCDHSSAVIEASIFNKPILFYDSINRNFNSSNTLQIYRQHTVPFHDPSELHKLIDKYMFHALSPHHYEKLLNHFCANQGGASDAAAEFILGLGRVCSSKSAKWMNTKKRFCNTHTNKC